MIVDSLTYLPKYRGLHPALDTAIDYLASHDLAKLPNGRTEIDGTRVFVNLMETDLRPAETAQFEYHHRYADLQVDLTGAEHWGWTAAGQPSGSFDETADCGFLVGPEQASGLLGEGRFALFFPGEAHKPSCETKDCAHLRKAVIKVEMCEQCEYKEKKNG